VYWLSNGSLVFETAQHTAIYRGQLHFSAVKSAYMDVLSAFEAKSREL
jgi:hypothetical protein